MNNQEPIFNEIPYGSASRGIYWHQISGIVKAYNNFNQLLEDSQSQVRGQDQENKRRYDELLRKYPRFFDTNKMPLGFERFFNSVIGNANKILRINPNEIKFPPEKGKNKVLGLLIPFVNSYSLNSSNMVIFEIRKNQTAHMTLHYPDNTQREIYIQINVSHEYYGGFTGTYELGKELEGVSDISLDMNIGKYSSTYDPSAEFEP